MKKIKDLTWILSNTIVVGSCLEWTKCLNSDGYPRLSWNGNENGKVHRIVYELISKENIEGKSVCHKCDNPKCINPNHLFLGTASDNMRDRTDKDRTASKLTPDDVKKIRILLGEGLNNTEIAEVFNVNNRTISEIKRGNTWKRYLSPTEVL